MENTEHDLPFELIVGSETGEIMNGDVPVRWCVTPALVKQLEDDGITDPHILLLTATESGLEMQRQIVPITELMTYVRFTRAGTMKLYGFILDGKKGRTRMRSMYMQRAGGEYHTDIIFSYTNKPHESLPFVYEQTEVSVVIPEGVFGKEPGVWMKWFVNLWHTSKGKGKVVDECHYRQRLMLAFSVKWLPVLIWTTMLVTWRVFVTGALALSGYHKNVKFMRSFRPYKWSSIELHLLDEIDFNDNAFLFKRKSINYLEEEESITMVSTLPFFPLVLLIQTPIVFALADYFMQTMLIVTAVLLAISVIWDLGVFIVKWMMTSPGFEKFIRKVGVVLRYIDDKLNLQLLKWIISIFLVGVFAAFAMNFVVAGLILAPTFIVFGLLFKYGDEVATWLNNIYTVAPDQNDYTEIRELLCPKDELNLKPDINLIPPKQRTVRLWYLDLKNKVCKPMQQ